MYSENCSWVTNKYKKRLYVRAKGGDNMYVSLPQFKGQETLCLLALQKVCLQGWHTVADLLELDRNVWGR